MYIIIMSSLSNFAIATAYSTALFIIIILFFENLIIPFFGKQNYVGCVSSYPGTGLSLGMRLCPGGANGTIPFIHLPSLLSHPIPHTTMHHRRV